MGTKKEALYVLSHEDILFIEEMIKKSANDLFWEFLSSRYTEISGDSKDLWASNDF